MRAMLDTRPLTASVPRVTAPTLVAWGRANRASPVEQGRRLARELGGARFEVFDCGRSPAEECPEAFATRRDVVSRERRGGLARARPREGGRALPGEPLGPARRQRSSPRSWSSRLSGPLVARHGPLESDFVHGLASDGVPVGPSAAFPLGADRLFRDVFARLAYAGRVSLLIAVLATLIASALGALVGIASGWYEGAPRARPVARPGGARRGRSRPSRMAVRVWRSLVLVAAARCGGTRGRRGLCSTSTGG